MAWESAPPSPWPPPPLGPETWAPGTDLRRLRFSRTEIRHLSLALGALVAAFAILDFTGSGPGGARPNPLFSALLALLIVGPAFVLHELAHKAVAQRKGCWAEFRAYPLGLLLMLATSLLGFLFAAPGAVMIAGNVGRRDYGRIGAAGPMTNVVIASLALPLALTPLREVAFPVVSLNLFLAGFNMIPWPPFDGEKVLKGGGKSMYAGVLGAIFGVAGAAWLLLRMAR